MGGLQVGAARFNESLKFDQALRLNRNLRRPKIAAAAIPNNAIIGGAGTSVPLEPPELELLEEVELLVEEEELVEVEVDELVLDVTFPEVDVLVDTSPEVDVEVDTSPDVELVVVVLTSPVLVETLPVDVDT